VRLRYALLYPERVSLLDAQTEIPLSRVKPHENAHRSRAAVKPPAQQHAPKTGLNAAELILARAAGIDPERRRR
jgi:hypothetical protein